MNKPATLQRLTLAALLAAPAFGAHAQLAVPAGSTLAVSDGSTLAVTGNIVNAGTLDNQGTVQLTGHLSSTGTLPLGATVGLWRLAGTAAQQLSVVDQLSSLEVANAAGGDLLAPLLLGQLSLSGGPLRLGAYSLVISTGGSITDDNGAAGRFVVTGGAGQLTQTVTSGRPRLFPIGPAVGSYAPATITRSSGAAAYSLRAAAEALSNGSSGPPYTADAVGLRWELAPPDATAFGLSVQWNQAQELGSFNRNQSALSRWTGSGYVQVEPFGNAGGSGAGPYARTVSGLTAAGPYIVADQQAPLPVELTRFEARRSAGRPVVELTWITAQEQNNQGFEVQRRDEGQTAFRRVGFVAGQGTTTAVNSYRFLDANDFGGRSYYRLRQLDLDGTETYSEVRAVAGLPSGRSFSLTAFPNPAATRLTLETTGAVPAGLQLSLLAADGRLVRRLEWPAGQRQLPLEVEKLPSGGYWLRYAAPDGTRGTLSIIVAH